MGLDGVELVMALEEAFGVELKDEEVFKAVTPRLIGDIIFSKLQATDERVCQSQRSFYVLRRALMRQFGLRRGEVTLDRKLREFIPRERERDLWPALKEAVQARSWPRLVRSRRLVRGCQAVGTALFAACRLSDVPRTRISSTIWGWTEARAESGQGQGCACEHFPHFERCGIVP